MTLVWFVVWVIANTIGGHEPLLFHPANGWVITLLAAVAVDLSGSGITFHKR